MEAGSPTPGGAGRKWNLADLGLRAASAVVMVALALGTLWLGGHAFAAFWALAGMAVFWEWQHLVGGPRMTMRTVIGAGVVALGAAMAAGGAAELAVLVAGAGAIACAWAAGADRRLWAAGGALYAGALVISVCVLRNSLFHGVTAILWLFAVVWGTDVMAYFGGRLIGGPKLWPRVSPSKTWSGFLVGVCSAAFAGLAVVVFWTTPGEIRLAPLFLIGLAAAALSQAGDLFESSIKRRFGVKDSGRLIPGHGGAMDRLDGFIFATTFAAIVGAAHKGFVAAAHGLLVW